jgi:hypothetical protein
MISEAAAKLRRAAIGTTKQREKDRLAIRHKKPIAAFFKRQKGAVLSEMDKYQFLFSESYRKLSESNIDFTGQNWDRVWDGIAQDTEGELQHIIAAASADGLAAGADQLRRVMFDPKTTFNLANPRAVRWFQDNGGSVDKIRGIQQTTGDQIKAVITNAIDKGWSYDQTAKEISRKFDGFSKKRGKTIAVYETSTAYEQGNKLFAQSLIDDGVMMQESWVTSHDSKVRPEHAANEAEGWVPIGHIYSSGDIDCPTDPGCRCFKIYQEVPK